MKKTIIILLVIFMVLSCITSVVIGGVLVYKNNTDKDSDAGQSTVAPTKVTQTGKEMNGDGYTVRYPETWEIRTVSGQKAKYLYPKKNDGTGASTENINILVDDSGDATLDEYTSLSRKQLASDDSLSVSIVSEDAIEVNGLEGVKLEYNAEYRGVELKFASAWFVSDGKAYSITYSADAEDYNLFIDDVENIIDSFRLE